MRITHALGRLGRRYYFEDYMRVYPGGTAFNRLGWRRSARPHDLKNFKNHMKFYGFAAQFVPGQRVVDVGCGSGYGCKIVSEAGAREVHGSDVSAHALRFARDHFGEYASFTQQSITELSGYPDGFADVVISSEVIEHIKEYGLEGRALGELRRITRPGGLVVISTPNSELLGEHGFSWDELTSLFRAHFDDYCIFENALAPFEPDSRRAWEARSAEGRTGIVVSEPIVFEETVLPESATPEVKKGLAPGQFAFSDRMVDTTLLHNTHSWVGLAVCPAPDTTRTTGKRVLLVGQFDGYANGVKPAAVEAFLRKQGHDVNVFNSYYLSRGSRDPGSHARRLPRPGLRRLGVYATELSSLLFTRHWSFGRRHLSYYLLLADYYLRRSLLRSRLPLDEFDLIICEHPQDVGLLTVPTSALRFYDCPDPYADELWYEGRLTERQRDKFRIRERELYESVDGLSFSWESYARYAEKHYGISRHNLKQLNWGCYPLPPDQRASFSDPPRVVYMGSLSRTARYIDLPLLSRLSKLYPYIDVYGGPPPDPALGLNYRGWAPPTALQQYQFGLITCTTDELRRDGFSAKHLDYISYGLPVLVPAWRRHMDLLRGSVPYEEDTFVAVIEALSNETEWRRVSDESYAQAERLTWDKTLQPLEDLLSEPAPEPAT
ncbi:MAG: methyltransferase domain-containing protein [Solirubrobacteraceae bacterium]